MKAGDGLTTCYYPSVYQQALYKYEPVVTAKLFSHLAACHISYHKYKEKAPVLAFGSKSALFKGL